MNVESLAEKITSILGNVPRPAAVLPPVLLHCIAIRRGGISLIKTFAKTIADASELGLNTEKNPDGTDNDYNILAYCIEKNVFDAIKNDMVIQTVGLAGSIMFTGTGANAGGPVVVNGTNSNNVTMMGAGH